MGSSGKFQYLRNVIDVLAVLPVKLQSDMRILTRNLSVSELYEIFMYWCILPVLGVIN